MTCWQDEDGVDAMFVEAWRRSVEERDRAGIGRLGQGSKQVTRAQLGGGLAQGGGGPVLVGATWLCRIGRVTDRGRGCCGDEDALLSSGRDEDIYTLGMHRASGSRIADGPER